jgi:hypothetical protein
MEFEIFKDPINLSLASGSLAFILSSLILYIFKPNSIMRIDEKNDIVVDRFRLFVMSVMISAGVSICVFLWLYKEPVVEQVKMKFFPNAISY